MNQNDLFFNKLPSIRSAIQKAVLSLSLHDLIQVNLIINDENSTKFVEGNEVNDILRSVINFQNSMMKSLIKCQTSDNFSDVNLITVSGDDSDNFGHTEFTVIESIRKSSGGTILSFYATKKALKAFPIALETYNSQKDGFENLVLPQVDALINLGPQNDEHIFSLFFTGLELLSLSDTFEIETPITRSLSEFLPSSLAEFCENLDQTNLFALIILVNATFTKPLLDLLCAQVANMIRGKSPEQIRSTFNIQNGKL